MGEKSPTPDELTVLLNAAIEAQNAIVPLVEAEAEARRDRYQADTAAREAWDAYEKALASAEYIPRELRQKLTRSSRP